MVFFFCRLVAPRATFAQDMTESERELMVVHGGYWRSLAEKGVAVVFGPVMDPKGTWGLVIVEAKDEAEVHALMINDPVVKTNAGFRYEINPMAQAVFRKGL